MSKLNVAAVALFAVGGFCGCSASTRSELMPGTLYPGTAAIVISGQSLGVTNDVKCTHADWLTTITSGNDASGITLMVSNAGELSAEFVGIRNLNGFAGAYYPALQGKASATMEGSTYKIIGDAHGVNEARPAVPATEAFEIQVAC